MGLGKFFGKGEGIKAVGKIADDLFTSKEEKLELALKEKQLQADINRQEAQHRSVFVAGWRPAIGWVCAAGLAWSFVIHPLLTWILPMIDATMKAPPQMELGPLMTLLTGMLGLGAMRSWEKNKKLTK